MGQFASNLTALCPIDRFYGTVCFELDGDLSHREGHDTGSDLVHFVSWNYPKARRIEHTISFAAIPCSRAASSTSR